MNWYIRIDLKPTGPFTEEEIRVRLLSGEISPEDLIWQEGVGEWKAALMWTEFRQLHVPAFQEVNMVSDEAKEWILLEKMETGHRTTGPWTLNQIRWALREGRVTVKDHLWKKGMTGWARIESRPENLISAETESPSLL